MARPLLPDGIGGALAEVDSRVRKQGNQVGTVTGASDPDAPLAITGLAVTSSVERDTTGRDRARVDVSWDPAGTVPATDEAMDVAAATVRDYGYSHSVKDATHYTGDTTTDVPAAAIHGLPIGTQVYVRVRARSQAGVWGPYSFATLKTAVDGTASGAPSTPTTESVLSGVRVKWDGLLADGSQPPNDADRVRVYINTDPTAVQSEASFIGEMGVSERAYTYPVRNRYGVSFYAALRIIDRSGNLSPFSGVSNGSAPGQVVTEDVANDIKINARAVGTFGGGNGVTNSNFAAKTESGAPDGFYSWTQVVSAFYVQADKRAFYGDSFAVIDRVNGALGLLASNRIPVAQTGPKAASAWIYLETPGMTPRVDLYNPDGPQPVLAEARKQPDAFKIDPNKTGVWQRIATVYESATRSTPQGQNDLALRVLADSGPSGRFWVGAVQMEEGDYVSAYAPKPDEITPGSIGKTQIRDDSISTAKVIAYAIVANKIQAGQIGAVHVTANTVTATNAALENAVVLNAKIRDLAVDAAKIGYQEVTSQQIGEMTAERITTGTLRAATQIVIGNPQGNRVLLDSNGIRLIRRSGGVDYTTVALDVGSGQGRFQGEVSASTITGSTLRTGDSGNYIILSDLSQRDKIQFVNGDRVTGTLTSASTGLVVDASRSDGSGGNLFLGSGLGTSIVQIGRRDARYSKTLRAGRLAVETNDSGYVDVPYPGASFEPGVIPNFVLVTPENNSGGAAITAAVSDFSENGFRLWFYAGTARVKANRIVNIYAEAVTN